jgi:mycobactin peptide synthetase MbtE
VILQDDLKPCGTLVTGMLYIVSDFMTKGYLNNKDLTDEKFVQLELQGKNKVRAFKTGDKARKLASGKIELLGRDDRQIKLRGIRIELDEIENAVAQAPFISNAVVVCNTAEDGNQHLEAFVVKNKDWTGRSDIADMALDYVQQYLPAYAIPSFTEIDKIPLLSNGKINYKELSSLLDAADIVPPANKTEEQVLAIWKEILGDRPLSADISFHAAGGNSLSIMKLIARVYKEFQVRITLNELFNNLTVKKQAALINACKKDDVLVIPKAISKSSYNLSASQERMFYNYELDRESTAYNLPMAWEIKGNADMAKLLEAMQQLVQRHEALRTAFKVENGFTRQVINEEIPVSIGQLFEPGDDAAEAIRNFIRPFNLTKAPLFRSAVINMESGRKVLVFDIHHIVCDGISQVNLFSDFLKLYKGEQPEPITIQYKDYAEWEHNFKFTNEFNQHREYWLTSFEGQIPKMEFPVNMQEEESAKGGNVYFKISRSTLNPVFDLLKKDDVTVFSALYSIFSVFLTQLTGQDDMVIGINTAGRIQQETEPLAGMFVKTLPIRQTVNLDQHFVTFAKKIHQNLVLANSRQIYDLVYIYRELNKISQGNIERLFDVMFVFQNFEDKIVTTEGVEFSSYFFENETYKYPITLFASEEKDDICFRFEYSGRYFTVEDVNFLAENFKEVAAAIASNLHVPLMESLDTSGYMLNAADEAIAFNF